MGLSTTEQTGIGKHTTNSYYRERERERERERQTQTQTQTQKAHYKLIHTDRQMDRQTDR